MRDRLPMIFSITALLVAILGVTPLGEAAYNAIVPRNSVGTLQLQRNAVKAAKIAPSAIRTGHVLDGTLLVADFKAGQIPQGPKGDKGDKGDRGAPGPTEGASSVDSNPAVPASLTNQWNFSTDVQSSFTTSRAGRLLLVKGFTGYMTCPPGVWWWITLDNAVVRESAILGPGGALTNTQITLSAVTTQVVPAGQHTLAVGAMCYSGPRTSAGVYGYSGGSVVVLG